jgi:hypothetical protein
VEVVAVGLARLLVGVEDPARLRVEHEDGVVGVAEEVGVFGGAAGFLLGRLAGRDVEGDAGVARGPGRAVPDGLSFNVEPPDAAAGQHHAVLDVQLAALAE